ncbi:MAG: peptidoglycan editing factor PgeF [Peptococcaceae bacterium]|nr:peptidoglycan editing factor PgeF [Peptococcaceae bacterium]MDH7524331.1 peptidoglycan editing factor PgeF [Peptococcaceae bacterium]
MTGLFVKKEKEGITFYQAASFEAAGLVVHAFTGRKGGVSRGLFESLNLSILTQDLLENVLENRRRLCGILGISPDSLTGARQVHGDSVYLVRENDKGRGARQPGSVIPAADALMTAVPGITLVAFFADCVPVFFLDPVKKAVALTHAGWKGTVAGIAAKTAAAMTRAFGTKPEDLLAAVGPSIGPCHYQVDGPVIERVRLAFPDDYGELLPGMTADGHARFNLWEANVRQIRSLGVPAQNITVAGICTYCEQENFFSHRRGMAGRQAALIMLKNEQG